jgi:superfamily II DNA helicase RecQ
MVLMLNHIMVKWKKEKTSNQDAFIKGEVPIMVATSAFGMGVDKKDVGMVIHYEISDSLENYIQEAGRAGRDENIVADCFVLFNEEDLSKHFIAKSNKTFHQRNSTDLESDKRYNKISFNSFKFCFGDCTKSWLG